MCQTMAVYKNPVSIGCSAKKKKKSKKSERLIHLLHHSVPIQLISTLTEQIKT